MKNLENFGVKELNQEELKNNNGGDFGISLVVAGIALTLAALNTDWDKVGEDISNGWHSL
ncbi:hypothetical protein [Tenacibaculum xiamenense]|uniref:hypothetical protein n=1 Tax=Tenacibaculum xiamenense TaxID=1261553 RepID=UPI0038B424F0